MSRFEGASRNTGMNLKITEFGRPVKVIWSPSSRASSLRSHLVGCFCFIMGCCLHLRSLQPEVPGARGTCLGAFSPTPHPFVLLYMMCSFSLNCKQPWSPLGPEGILSLGAMSGGMYPPSPVWYPPPLRHHHSGSGLPLPASEVPHEGNGLEVFDLCVLALSIWCSGLCAIRLLDPSYQFKSVP